MKFLKKMNANYTKKETRNRRKRQFSLPQESQKQNSVEKAGDSFAQKAEYRRQINK
jgi:hypothetical protein